MHRTACPPGALAVAFLTGVLGCRGVDKPPVPDRPTPPDPALLTAPELAALTTLSPLGPVPSDPTNAYADDPRAAALGQMLFFDEALSGPLRIDGPFGPAGASGKLSCRTCHAGPALDDQRAGGTQLSHGTGIGPRNAPPILNAVYYRWSNWGGRFDTPWALALGAAENPDVMNASRLGIAHTLFAKYRAEYDAVFPVPLDAALDPAAADAARFPPVGKPKATDAPDGPWEAMAPADRAIIDRIFANAGKAIAAYMRTLVARDAPFDRFVAGDRSAISPAAQRGLRVFLAHCESCHGGPHFEDGKFHAIGVAQFGANVPDVDLGRFKDVPPLLASTFNAGGPYSDAPRPLTELAQTDDQRGTFRTPTLRNVAVTAPYMHAGQLPTLEKVVAFYNVGGGRVDGVTKSADMKRLDLTPTQQADLVEFMKTLTDTRVPPERLVDTSR